MRGRRGGLSSVYGFIVLFALLMAGIGAALTIMNSQASVWNAQDRARQIQASQQTEHLALSLNGTSLTISNIGLIPSQIAYLYQRGGTSSADERIGASLQEGSNLTVPLASGMSTFAVITSLGNVFWAYNATQSHPITVPITFDASGLDPSFSTATILTVDGASYTYSDMPKTFQWASGSRHTYSYTQAFATASGSRLGWSYARGLDSAMAGTVTASQPGNIESTYAEQYLLTEVGGNSFQFIGSPGDDGWYDAGSTAHVTSNYVWNIAAGSRQNLYSYSVDGSSPTIVPRSGTGSYVSVGVTMNAPHAISLNAVTQYQLTVAGGNGITYSNPSQTSDGWYDSGSSLTISSNYAWGIVAGQSRLNLDSWSLDGGTKQDVVRSGSGTFTTPPIIMDTSHTASFASVTQYLVTTSASIPRNGTVGALNMSYSYTSPPASTSYLSCPGLECEPTGSMPNNPWFNVNSGVSIVSSHVHSGARAAYTTTFPSAGPYQSIGLPPHATLTSIIFSAWIYGSPVVNGSGPAQLGVNCGGYQDTTLAVVPDSSNGDVGFNLYSGSWTGSCTPPMNEDAVCSYSNLGGFNLASPCVTIFGRAGQCNGHCGDNGGTPGAAYFDDFAWTVTYFYPVSGSTGSTANTFSVSGTNVTYSYGVGYSFPSGSTSPSWSATWSSHSSEVYSSNTCGGSVSGTTITGSGGPCAFTTTRSGTVPISIISPTGDGWLDSGVAADLSTSPTGPFSFTSWSANSGGISVASSSAASTTVTATTFGTITAIYQVNQ